MRVMSQKLREFREARPGKPAPTERGEATRRAILDVAAGAFAESGYAGASLNDIIKEAGVTKGGFYFHFPSKEALGLAVLRYKQEQWAGRVLAATMRHATAMDQMNAMVEALITLHEQDPAADAIGRLCQELAENPEMVPQLAPQFEVWIDMTASLFARAQEEGVVRPEFDPHSMGEAAVATFVGLEIMSKVEGTPIRPRVLRYVELYRQAFSKEPES
jgi:AcrR family transcriptional regulator